MHPTSLASRNPDKPAYIMAESGEVVSRKELDELSNQGAHLFRKLGLKRGDHIALMMENHPRYLNLSRRAAVGALLHGAQLPPSGRGS
ncbi:MAG: AMP-binding protein [Gammaproteobacteria bacterium]|nr:AMP-binding protein [Gammaproteobacteria bacterium]